MSTPPTQSEQLSAWLDGELDDGEAAAVERELERDARLRAELDELREVRELLRTHGPRKAPKRFHAAVMAKVDQEPLPANHSMFRFLRRPFGVPIEALAVAAAALFVVLAGLNLGTSALEAPFEEFDLGSRGSSSTREKGDLKEEVAAPVAPPQEQAVDPGGDGDQQAESSYDREPKPQVKKAKPASKSAPEETLQVIRGGAKEEVKVGADTTTAEGSGTAEVPTTTSAGTSQRKEPTPEQAAPSGWRFHFTTNPDFLGTLLRIAKQSGGTLVDSNHVAAPDGTVDPGDPTVYWLRVPAEQLNTVVGKLKASGGRASEQSEQQFNPGQYVTVRIDLMLADAATRSSTPSTKSYEPKK